MLHIIFRALRSSADHAHASAVCRDWSIAAASNPRATPMLRVPSFTTPLVGRYSRISFFVCFVLHPAASQQPQPPAVLLPMLASTASPPPLPIRAWTPSPTPPSTASRPFLRPFGQGSCYVEGFPEDAGGARLCGSFLGGWVALELTRWRGHCLININTGHRINLPDRVRNPAPPRDCVVGIKSMVLSAAPTSGAYMVAAITSGVSNICFWRPGAERWWPLTPVVANAADLAHWRRMLPRDPIMDMVYFRGRLHEGFYVLDGQERLVVYVEDENGGNGNDNNGGLNPINMRMITYAFASDLQGDSDRVVRGRYLIESRGDLIMVRHLDCPEGFEFFTLEAEEDLGGDQVRAKWLKCSVLAGRALFLGRGCSRSAESGSELGHIVHCSVSSEDTEWFYL